MGCAKQRLRLLRPLACRIYGHYASAVVSACFAAAALRAP
jgi:hypothetical protein